MFILVLPIDNYLCNNEINKDNKTANNSRPMIFVSDIRKKKNSTSLPQRVKIIRILVLIPFKLIIYIIHLIP